MKNRLIKFGCLILTVVFAFLALAACNSREDVKHISQNKMVKYVQSAIDEDISLISVEGTEQDNKVTYTFNLDNRDITFTATSCIGAMFIDGSQFGNFNEDIYIEYEEGIADSYLTKSSEIAQKYDIDDVHSEVVSPTIHVTNYEDIEKVAKFVIELDELYAFKENKTNRIEHIRVGTVAFSDPGNSIEGPMFSTNDRDRLKYSDVYNEILDEYTKQLKKFSAWDDTIPDKIWSEHQENEWG